MAIDIKALQAFPKPGTGFGFQKNRVLEETSLKK
jgi:hypothetical protein